MKQKLLNKLWLRVGMIVAIMTTALSGTVWADTVSYTATSDDKPTATNGTVTGTVTGTNSISWSYSVTQSTKSGKSPYVAYSDASGWQLGSGSSLCTAFSISTSGISGTITQIDVVTGSKSASSKINVTVGGNAFGTQNQNTGSGATVETQTFTGSASGEIVVSASASSAAFYFKSVTVTYTTSGTPTPSISANDVNIEYSATNGSIAYTLSNATGNVTASVEGDWLTLGTITSSAVPFTCSENPGKTARTATVTLSYPDAPNKVVHVTQAGNPNVVDNISDITAAGTYTVKGTIVAKSQRGFIVGDGTGYVYYYNQNYTQSNYNIGDKVKLDGSVVVYGGVFEFNNSTTVTAATESNYVAEEPTVLTGSQMDTRVGSTTPAELSTYVQYEGVLTISDTHYNITSIDGASTAKGSISYPISTDFTSLSGKTVKVTGYYVGVSSSQYYNTMLGSIEVVNTDPVISASDVNIAYDATSGEIAYTIANQTGATLTATTSADWISNIVVSSDKVSFTATANEGNADRTATITLSYTGAQDKVVTVTQGHYVADYATLPFSFDGGRADIANTAGLTETGLGTDYKNSPYLKLDETDDYVLLKINERPGVLTFDIQGNSFSGGTFTVQTSEDGMTYTDLETYTELGSTQSEEFSNLGENVRYIKWVYTSKSSGNVALGNIALAQYEAPANYDLTVTLSDNISAIYIYDAADQTEALIEDGAAGTVQVTNGTEILVSPDVAAGYQLASLTVDGNDVTSQIDETGAYTFTMPAHAVTVTATAVAVTPPTPASGKYVKVTSTDDLTDGQYLIVYEDGGVAFDGSLETLDATGNTIEVTINNNEIAATSTTTAAEFTIDVTAGTIKSASGEYIFASSYNNELKTSTSVPENTNTFSFNSGDAVISVAVTETQSVTLKYNSASNQTRFRYYKSGQQAIQLYKKVESVTVTTAGYATYCSENALDFTNTDIKAYVGTKNGDKLTFIPINQVPANTGMLLVYAGGKTENVPVSVSPETVQNNCLVGVNAETTINSNDYILNKVNDGVGFYKAGEYRTLGAHKAYIPAAVGNGVKGFAIDFDDDATGISLMEDGRSQMEDGVIYNLAGQRLDNSQFTIHNSQLKRGIYIVNGKKILK